MSGRSSRRGRAGGAPVARAALGVLVTLGGAACDGSRDAGHGGGVGAGARKGEPLRVAAAADLAVAFAEVGAAFEQASGKKVAFSFGSTGLLAKQIREGAPFDVFAAANVSYAEDVVRADACYADTLRLYARGRIVLWSKDKAQLPATLEQLREPRFAKVALANPEHAPYGLAAQQALTRSGVWPLVQTRAVYGENVQQALMFAQSGNAEVAVVALSLAMTSGGSYLPIDPELHAPLEQAMVICRGGSAGGKPNEARAFVEFASSEAGRTIMRTYGFLLPGDAAPSSK